MTGSGDIRPRWHDMDTAMLAAQYSPSSVLDGGLEPYLAAYRERSAAAYRTAGDVTTIRYGPGPAHSIDVARPRSPRPAPLLVFIHGGYWQELSKLDSFFLAPASLARGMAFAAIDYTLAPQATLDEIVAECCAAVTELVDDADLLGIDPRRVVLSGSSAGAQLAAMCGLLLPPTHRPAGIVAVSGVYELEPLLGTYVNDAVGMDVHDARRNSPGLADLSGFPPTVVAWGEHETDEFKRQGRSFATRLAGAGSPVTTLEVRGRNHFDVVHDIAGRTELGNHTAGLAGV